MCNRFPNYRRSHPKAIQRSLNVSSPWMCKHASSGSAMIARPSFFFIINFTHFRRSSLLSRCVIDSASTRKPTDLRRCFYLVGCWFQFFSYLHNSLNSERCKNAGARRELEWCLQSSPMHSWRRSGDSFRFHRHLCKERQPPQPPRSAPLINETREKLKGFSVLSFTVLYLAINKH